MPPKADLSGPRLKILLAAVLPAVFILSLTAPLPAGAQDGSPESYLDPSLEVARKRAAIVAGGLEFPISGSQGVQPQLSGYLDIPRNMQLGIKARVDLREARTGYDYIPQVGLHLRQLWLSDQDSSSVENSEYLSLVVGGYMAYDFQGLQSGLKPFGAVALGKYWIPFDNAPYGLDFCLEITRYFDGHPPSKPRNHFLSAGVNLFYLLP